MPPSCQLLHQLSDSLLPMLVSSHQGLGCFSPTWWVMGLLASFNWSCTSPARFSVDVTGEIKARKRCEKTLVKWCSAVFITTTKLIQEPREYANGLIYSFQVIATNNTRPKRRDEE